MTRPPKTITVASLEVVVMPNGEVICAGQTVGWVTTLGKYLTPKVSPADHRERAGGGVRGAR